MRLLAQLLVVAGMLLAMASAAPIASGSQNPPPKNLNLPTKQYLWSSTEFGQELSGIKLGSKTAKSIRTVYTQELKVLVS